MAKRRSPARSNRKTQRSGRNANLQDVVSPRLRAARNLWLRGQQAEAFRLFESAIREEPRNVRPIVDAARAYATKYQLDRTELLLDRLRNLSDSDPGVHHLAGDTYSLLKLLPKAVAAYERASALPGALPVTWVELASLCERANRLEEASELVTRALAVQPEMPLGLFVQAQLERRRGAFDQAISHLHTVISGVPEGSELFCRSWAEIAAIQDQHGDYDGAMQSMGHCKRALLAQGEADWKASERILGRFVQMVDSISAADFRRWQEHRRNLPTARVALLTGFPRSGTTLLEQVLDAHPELVSSEERDFVAREMFPSLQQDISTTASVQDVLHRVPNERLLAERQRYFSVMEWMLGSPIGDRVHLDKNPAYNLTIPIMLRIFPEMRFLVALRDPRDVVLSCFMRCLPLNTVSVRFLTLERTADRYALDMRAWVKFRDLISAPWCEIRYEDTVADLRTTAQRAVAALGLPWTDEVVNYRQRLSDKHISSPTYAEVTKPVHSRAVGRWQNYEKYLAPVMKTLEPFVHTFGYD